MGANASQITSLTIVYSAVYLETGEFPAQMANNAENASIWWRHHEPKMVAVPIWPQFHNGI